MADSTRVRGVAKLRPLGCNPVEDGRHYPAHGVRVDGLTQLLARMQDGDSEARDAFFAACYDELKRLAHSRLRSSARNTVLDTTALVHESYLRLVRVGQLRIEDRHAFFGYAARVMRSVIVDCARARLAERRGSGKKLTLSTEIAESVSRDEEGILRVHEALEALAQADERLATVVEMRYFAGYNETEIAESLGVTERTVRRDWDKARRLLQVILKSD